MEIKIDETQLRCYEDGRIERLDKRNNKWIFIDGSNCNGYLMIGIDKKMYYFHRIIYKAFNPEMDETLVIDHINRIKNDNRLINLRLVTNQQNGFNIDAKGYRKVKNSFRAQIKINGDYISKCFKTEDKARNWYLEQKAIFHVI